MGRKVLFSFLGLGDYIECIYEYEGKTSTLTRFIQTSILEQMRDEGLQELVVFATKEAKSQNWQDHENEKGFFEGLENALQRITPEANVKLVEISSSQDEEANWNLFDTILSEIQEGDEIYFDITHSFRSIPFVALIVLNYARLIKKATIRKIVYGLFDPKQPDIPALIVDVTNMATLLDWTIGVDQFLKTGDATAIKELTNRETGTVFKNRTTSNEEKQKVKALNQLAAQLNRIGQSFQTCRSLKITEEIQELRNQIEVARDTQTSKIKPLAPLLDEIEKKYEEFRDDEIMNLFYSAKWCSENHLTQQGYTMLLENCITAICKVFQINEIDSEKRMLINSAIRILSENIPETKWKVKEENVPFVREMVSKLQPYKNNFAAFNSILDLRNDINHGGARESQSKVESFQPKLNNAILALKPFFEKMSSTYIR
ncbi:TIGR02221 family CRISPR-associated protein [Ureibacillus thermosphaericus]|uniref:CRISPR-associated Csx2 family protein n=1 Tax=Ureibacillus thermosphaericus TaxID=51173 RepID=A0A840PT66_URETH|nr:TIGR02221 family CRISPR-associated protein [Ureibacillus thermosphaericus]MBB5149080.1 CRISPR-associated Csx2 family protein [Ureibacillus thermosphaericus]NKZ31844.1 TIGR02221 family CRISPR-associated protein [Ureibacillus thermosphaericus]